MIESQKLPANHGSLRPKRFRTKIESTVATSCAPLAIKGAYNVKVWLYSRKRALAWVTIIFIPLNCCIKCN